MTRIRQLFEGRYTGLVGNVAARFGGLLCAFLASLLLARNGGPAVVGIYALLHVLPALVGMIFSSGLPGAVTYFLARHRGDRRLPATLVAIAVAGGVAGTGAWAAAAPLVGPVLFSGVPLALVMLSGALVLTRLVVTTAKSCSQGSDDLAGANRVIFMEEFMFLPAYGLAWGAGGRGHTAVIVGLLLADVATATLAWARLVRRRFFQAAAPPSRDLARRVAAYGLRAQTGTIISQLNLRLDFVLLNILTGPAVLGLYAVASKFAELIRVFTIAVTYVLYPKFARADRATAAAQALKLVPKAGLLTAAAVVPLLLTAGFLVPAVYGSDFRAAIIPAQIILLGLALDGVGAVITGFFYGVGRPGLNSFAMAFGLAVTIVLDFLLIPRYESLGAAIASAIAYVTTTLALVALFWWAARPKRTALEDARLSNADAR